MSFWKKGIETLIDGIDQFSDKIRLRYRRRKGYDKPLKIVPYLGYGTPNKLFLSGRVVAEKYEILAAETDGRRRNLRNFFRRFATDEVPFAKVKAVFENVETETSADEEGYFYFEINAPKTIETNAPFRELELELIEPLAKNGEPVRAVGKVFIPPPSARFGVISDLDDTVITTDVTSKWRMLLNTALRNEYSRLPFKGVAAFYRALQKGLNDENNPFFYVSSSPWNLYQFLIEFLRINEIPPGALFLKDFGNHTIFNSGDHASHKTEKIERILNVYPQLPFILIGDSGERDPEIYREIVHKYPNRIRVIYIRSVNQDPERLVAIDKLIAEIAETKVQLILAPDTEFAAAHAAAEELISPNEMVNIREEKQADESPK
jgi:phosphatidate phosphatase APP1